MILFGDQMRGKEWEINQLTPNTRKLLSNIVKFCEYHDYHVYLTCVYRSDEEQRALYEKIGKPYEASVHTQWRGFDFRVFPWDRFNLWLCDKVNAMFPYDIVRPNLKSLLMHGGTAIHFHGQSLT